jgi:hypothetical protein
MPNANNEQPTNGEYDGGFDGSGAMLLASLPKGDAIFPLWSAITASPEFKHLSGALCRVPNSGHAAIGSRQYSWWRPLRTGLATTCGLCSAIISNALDPHAAFGWIA